MDRTVAPNEPESLQSIPPQQIPSESPKEKPISKPITTLPTKLRSELPNPRRTARHVDSARRLNREEYLRARYLKSEYLMIPAGLDKNSIGARIPEEALQIYSEAKNQQHRHPALYTYKKVANLLDPSISSQDFNVAIVGLWLARNPHKKRYKNGDSCYYYYIDGSGTIASERVNDYVDIRNIKEELARGI